jgi:uncharacterized Zn finger protein
VRCSECGCRHVIPVQKTQNSIRFRGRDIVRTRNLVRCRHCGHTFTVTDKDTADAGDIKT